MRTATGSESPCNSKDDSLQPSEGATHIFWQVISWASAFHTLTRRLDS